MFSKIQPLDRHSAKGPTLGPVKYRIIEENTKTTIEAINWSFKKNHENKRMKKPEIQRPRA